MDLEYRANTLQIHTDVVQAGVAFGYGSSASFMRISDSKATVHLLFRDNVGHPGQVLTSNGDGAPSWTYVRDQHINSSVKLEQR
jgi:hypothetical protein